MIADEKFFNDLAIESSLPTERLKEAYKEFQTNYTIPEYAMKCFTLVCAQAHQQGKDIKVEMDNFIERNSSNESGVSEIKFQISFLNKIEDGRCLFGLTVNVPVKDNPGIFMTQEFKIVSSKQSEKEGFEEVKPHAEKIVTQVSEALGAKVQTIKYKSVEIIS